MKADNKNYESPQAFNDEYGVTEETYRKGIILNSAFFVSGAFVLAGHLAFTLAYNPDYVLSVIVGKLTAGIPAVLFALVIKNK